MALIGSMVVVRGEVATCEDLLVDGRVEGSIWCDGCAVTISPAASVAGDILARDVTVFGSVDGSIVATDVIDIRASAHVTGRLLTLHVILADGALFNGTAEPQLLEAALRVARYRRSIPSSPHDTVVA